MIKSEFIDFLENQEKSTMTCWCKIYTNSDDYWKLYKPAVDCVEDDMDLTTEGIVKITYNKQLYTNTFETFETTYDDFVKNYSKTIR